MPINLKGKSFISVKDFSQEELKYLLDFAKDLKSKKILGITGDNLKGKNIVLLFEKSSTRTRCAFEVAVFDEGGNVTFLGMADSQFSKKESIKDSAKVLGRFYDGIEYRGFKQKTVEDLAKYSGIPVWNGLTDLFHPTQVLADYMTIKENFNKDFNDINFVFVGDARNNMGNSLLLMAAKMGVNFKAISPKELQPDGEILALAKTFAKKIKVI